MKYFSMFSGIAGFELGIGDKGECIGYSEIDKYAVQIYEKHYPSHKNYGDATKIIASELPDFDLLVGGFPCQAFSVAGKRQGFNDTRGTLFFDVARILAEKRPKYLVLENVKGLLSHDNGKTFQTILGVLADIGYVCEWRVLNAKFFGVPQNRERVFIIGRLGGQPCGKVFFVGENDQLHLGENEPKERWSQTECGTTLKVAGNIKADDTFIAENPVCPTIRATEYKGGDNQTVVVENKIKQLVGGSQGYRVYDPSGVSTTLASQAGGVGAKTGLYAIPVLTPDRKEKRQNGRRMKENGDPMFTINTQDKHGVFNGSRIRRLTPLECERLMSYPDGWTEEISDSRRYKCLGNGIVSNVVREVIEML